MRDFIEPTVCFLFALAMSYMVAVTIFVVAVTIKGFNPLTVCWDFFGIAPIYFIIAYVGLGVAMWPTLQTDY